jgi:uncharacterized protein YyaL (SSP411 family)
LTPDGRPYFGGTYFPKEDRYNRPGLVRVLLTMSDAWQHRREEVLESAGSVMEAIEQSESFAGRRGALSTVLVQKLVSSATSLFDSRHGGFGSQPKFPYPSTLDLLIDVSSRTGNEEAKKAAAVTLTAMARGGVYDQLGGGFHRYSVDERWIVPHFEKMLYDNAGLLRNYVHGYQTFVEEQYAAIARDIIRWMDEWLSDRDEGGFYASQDADINLDDDGDYFTWTLAEAKAVLSEEELRFAGPYWDIGELGDMHHDPARNVLHITESIEALAKKNGVKTEQAEAILATAKKKLYQARLQRPTPFVDKTIYTAWNGMAISAYFEAATALQLDEPRGFALKSLDRLLSDAWSKETGLSHVIAYPGETSAQELIAGVLDDYAFTVHACIDAWAVTGDLKYYRFAIDIADEMIVRFYDEVGSSFFDTEQSKSKPVLGALAARRKPLQDSPTPAGNPVAASALLRLESLSSNRKYHEIAEDTLESFAGIVEGFGMYASSYGLALEQLMMGPVQVVVVGEDQEAERMVSLATSRYAINKQVLHFKHEILMPHSLPPALAETLPFLPVEEGSESFAVICRGASCLPPVKTADALMEALKAAL